MAGSSGNSAWNFKNEHFDYTLGNGLKFIRTKYQVDAGLIVVGEDLVSSAGRQTAAIVGAVFGVVVPLGHSLLIGGLVDFETGDILWLNHKLAGASTDLRNPESAKSFAAGLMEGFPHDNSKGSSAAK